MPTMPKFRYSEEVSALKIKGIKPAAGNSLATEISFTEAGHAPIQVNAAWITEQRPQPGGWLVVDSKNNRRAMTNADFAARYQNKKG